MYITRQTDYAFRVLIYTAVNNESLVNIASIAEDYNISKSHLMKVVMNLVRGEFLISLRGKGGGLKLAREPKDIKLGEVVEFIEPFQIVECFTEENTCSIAPACRLSSIIGEGIKVFIQHLNQYTLADLLNKSMHDLLYLNAIPITNE